MHLKSALIVLSFFAFANAAFAQVPAAVTTNPPVGAAH
jgi:hypothetical protein